jgi:glycosyltransferase involved in cell wall biosynthesis
VIRVLHVPTLHWQSTEAIARSCRQITAELDSVESLLIVDGEPGSWADPFTDYRVVDRWTALTPWKTGFARALHELRPDVVHLHGGELAPALAFAPALRGLPVVATCYRSARLPRGLPLRSYELADGNANVSSLRSVAARAGARALARRALRSGRVRALCTPDEEVAQTFARSGPVLLSRGAANVSEHQARWSPAPVVAFAGRPQAGRGVDDLIAAFTTVRSVVPSARLRLALLPGERAESWKQQLARVPGAEVEIDRVAALDAWFAQCHVAAFPFRYSATLTPPLTAAEAMSAGVPVVGSSVSCLAPLIEDGRNGFSVPPNDPRTLAAAIVRVIQGPEAWQPLSEGARKTIEQRWSWSGAAAVVAEAYRIAQRRLP